MLGRLLNCRTYLVFFLFDDHADIIKIKSIQVYYLIERGFKYYQKKNKFQYLIIYFTSLSYIIIKTVIFEL